jgi:hypothetical protein
MLPAGTRFSQTISRESVRILPFPEGPLSAQRRFLVCLAALVGLTVGGSVAVGSQNTEREVLDRFQRRIDEYMALHRRLEKGSPALGGPLDQVRSSQKALAGKIRAERRTAAQGAIFDAETRAMFRRRLSAQLDGPDGAGIRRAISAEAPAFVLLRVNGEYPAGWSVSSVPPSILAALPKLPADLEYRFVRRDLILLDAHANLVVDFMRNAIR